MAFTKQRQENPRSKTLGAAFSLDERSRVLEALEGADFSSPSEGVREVLLAFTDSDAVRAAVLAVRGKMDRRQPTKDQAA